MGDARVGMQSALQQSFAAKAMLPNRDLDEARRFVDDIVSATARGDSVDATRVANGVQMLDKLDARCIESGYGFAILAGQDTGDSADLDRRIEAHAKGIDQISATAQTLRKTLAGLKVGA